MISQKSHKSATLIALLMVTSLAHAGEPTGDTGPSQGDGMSEADLARADDAAEACVRSDEIILPGGQSLYEYQKSKGETARIAADKKIHERLDSIKKPYSLGGEDFGPPTPERRRLTAAKISLYDKPGGRLLGTFPEKSAVGIIGQKDDWVLVQGYWSGCFERGWTQKKYLVKKSVDELKVLGVFGN